MDFNAWVSKSLNTFKKDVYRCHCYITDEHGDTLENTVRLRGFDFSTFEECLSNLVIDNYNVNYYDYNIVTDIVNKLVILTIKGNNLFRKITIDKAERISDIED